MSAARKDVIAALDAAIDELQEELYALDAMPKDFATRAEAAEAEGDPSYWTDQFDRPERLRWIINILTNFLEGYR